MKNRQFELLLLEKKGFLPITKQAASQISQSGWGLKIVP
jgi:hypothetical protein